MVTPFTKSATTWMTAFWLARREQPKASNTALWVLSRDNHCLRPMPCLERFGLLCTHQYNVVGVLDSFYLKILGVTKINSSRFTVFLAVFLNKLPITGRSPSIGTFLTSLLLVSSCTPPNTTVCPLSTNT